MHEFIGLTSLEAARILEEEGFNELPSSGQRGNLRIALDVMREPMFLLLDCTSLSTDESLLTGESVAVRKLPGDASSPVVQPGGDDLPFVYSGTLVVRGQGIARVVATGQQSAIGKIGKALQGVTSQETLLQRETGRLVKILAMAVLKRGNEV